MGVHGKSRFEVWGKEEGLGDVKGRKGGKEKSGKKKKWGGEGGEVGRWGCGNLGRWEVGSEEVEVGSGKWEGGLY